MTSDELPYEISHVYMSTWCLHGVHGECSAEVGVDANGNEFARKPAQCKICRSGCICACHRIEDA